MAKKIQKARTKSDLDAVNRHERDLNEAENDKNKEGDKLEADFVDFEAERVRDIKSVLLYYIHTEMAFHASCLQGLSKLYEDVSVIEPKEKLKDFVKLYGLTKMANFNLEDKYAFKEGETDRKQENIRVRTQRNTNQDEGNVKQGGNMNFNNVNNNINTNMNNKNFGDNNVEMGKVPDNAKPRGDMSNKLNKMTDLDD